MPPAITHHKHCSQCDENKPYSQFYKDRSRSGGYAGRCKDCNKANNRIRYAAKREELIAYQAEWRKKNPNYNRDYHRARANA